MSTRAWRLGLAAIVVLAAGVRLASFLELRDGPLLFLHHWSESDMAFYDTWARDVAGGDWLTDRRMRPFHSGHQAVANDAQALVGRPGPVSREAAERLWDRWLGEKAFYQEPLYSYLLAAVYRTLGRRVEVVVALQSIAGLGCVLLVAWLGTRLFDAETGLVAGALAAAYGPLVFYEAMLLRPVLVTLTGLLAVAAFVRAVEPEAPGRHLISAGFATGVACLARSTALLFLVLALPLVLRATTRGAWVRRVGLVGVGCLAALAPLAARNVAVGVAPWTFASSGAWTFLNHNAEDFAPLAGDTVSRHAADILVRTDGVALPVVAQTLRTHAGPLGVALQLFDKARSLTTWFEIPNNASFAYYLVQVPAARVLPRFGLVGPLLLAGVLLGVRSGPPGRRVLAAWLGAGVLTTLAFYSLARLRIPLVVAGLPFAAHAAVELGRRARAWVRAPSGAAAAGPVASGAAALVVAALVVHAPLPADVPRLRIADVGVANEITLARAREADRAGNPARALELIERQLRTEPEPLARLDPSAGPAHLAPTVAALAGTFQPLHAAAARLCRRAGRAADSQGHARHARLLQTVADAYQAGSRAPLP